MFGIQLYESFTVFLLKMLNYYKMDQQNYTELVNTNLTKSYKKTIQSEVATINKEAKQIAESTNLSDHVELLAQKEAFITLKDHKPNFDKKQEMILENAIVQRTPHAL